jgi:hypothetical protein
MARGFNHGRCVLKGQFGKRNHRNGYSLRPAVETAGYIFCFCVWYFNIARGFNHGKRIYEHLIINQFESL